MRYLLLTTENTDVYLQNNIIKNDNKVVCQNFTMLKNCLFPKKETETMNQEIVLNKIRQKDAKAFTHGGKFHVQMIYFIGLVSYI